MLAAGIPNALRGESKTMEHTHKRPALLTLLVFALLLVMAWPARGAMAESSPKLEVKSTGELAGKKLGMLNGSIFDQLIPQSVKGASSSDFLYFNSNAETAGALKAGKIDAMITDSPIAELVVNKNKGIGIMPESIMEDHYGYVLQKNSPLTEKFNERIRAYKADGTIDKLKAKWTSAEDSAKTMPEQGWDAPNGTLKVATSTDNEPVNYSSNGRVCGLCIELLELCARDLGYDVKYTDTNAASLISEVQSSKADLAAFSFSITDERKQKVDMTEPFYDGGVVAVARIEGYESNVGFFEGIAKSFTSTFITEGRWMLILSGLGVTLLISVTSGVLGFALGFLFVLLRRRREGGLADKVVHALESLMGGLPVAVVLMVFYYVIFGAIDISGIIVAILAFTIIFGAACGSIMWNAIRSIDVGQTEAGRALGFGDRDTFFLVVLPQAARLFAPLLVAQFVSLIKDTSVVGFIAVQDLTRVGDLIRARTMEAFFPLIAIAAIYFVLCRIIAWLLNELLVRRLELQKGTRTIEGVEL